MKMRVEIEFCMQCHWLLRAAWMAQELISTFPDDLAEVALKPGSGGVFRVQVGDQLIVDRKRDGGFPDLTALKRKVRDCVDPERSLGHIDRGD
ncbi:MAG: SelT/SelW/SelH family protein [Pseudomonadota bacterium]|jgi:selenoprotein W-related protein|nr:SelT/SelW/SelH family protein [Pseudomonadota bacterium]